MYEVKTPTGATMSFTKQIDVLRFMFGDQIPPNARFNMWRHLKRDEAIPGSGFRANTFLGHVVTEVTIFDRLDQQNKEQK